MTIALLLIPLALVLLGGAVYAFFWAVDNDQFDDLDNVARHAAGRACADAQPAIVLPGRGDGSWR